MYTNAQVADLVKALDARLARIERTLAGAPAASVAAPVAASPVAIPERTGAGAAPRFVCAKHPDHKDGKGFSRTGITAHGAWCDGEVTQK